MYSRKKAQAAFGFAVIVLLVSAVAAYATIVRLKESAHWVIHTYEVESALGELDGSLSALARARTMYVLTEDSRQVEIFRAGVADVADRVVTIGKLISDNPRQRDLFHKLDVITQQRLNLGNQALALRRDRPKDGAGQNAISADALNLATQSADVMEQMRDEEERLLKIRSAESNRLYNLTVILLAATFGLAVIFFLIHYRLLASELRARERAEHSAREGEQLLRHLTGRLLQMQDEERRKFSRELHDSLGQYLAGVKMNLEMYARNKSQDNLLESAVQLLSESIAETRTISHLLHPPLLDEVGFASAAKWYVQGFSERSGIHVDMEIPDNLNRLPKPVELALFRILQESLTNIHRHSKSQRAEVKLNPTPGEVTLRVKDYGSGMLGHARDGLYGSGKKDGVGLTGMRERVRELAGHLDIQSGPGGTLIAVSLPLPS